MLNAGTDEAATSAGRSSGGGTDDGGSGECVKGCQQMRIPTHIIHGVRDRLLPVACAHHLHALLPKARLTIYPLLGHCLDDGHADRVGRDIVAFINAVRRREE